MSGFDNGTVQNGVFFQTKQFGSILRGFGPPVPQAGVVGDLYIDVQTWQLFNKRTTGVDDLDPWGHYLFIVPLIYRTTLKWFNSYAPGNDVGATGDYCLLWAGWTNYGIQPSFYGPKQTSGWPENGNGPNILIAVPGAGTVLPVGLTGEGAAIPDSPSTQLIVVGLLDEYILPVPVAAGAGSPVVQQGLQSGPAAVVVAVNPLYTVTDNHAI